MQPAESYILSKLEPYRSILLHLQLVIEGTFKNVDLQFKWGIPFYSLKGIPFCYLNATKKGYVDVGFYTTLQLKKYNECIISDGRKAVKSLRYFKLEEINEKILVSVLREVYILNSKK